MSFKDSWIVNTFFKKDGKISKTSIFLSWGTVTLLLLYPFQALFGGIALGWWVVPTFSVSAATAVMGILSTLYVANHRLNGSNPTVEDMEKIREDYDKLITSMRRDDDGD